MKVQERMADYATLTNQISLRPLGDVTRPTRPRVKPSDKPHLPFIGMEHVEAHTMRLLGTVPASTMKSSAVHFQPGDLLYGRLRPYLNKVYRPDFEGLCSAEFIVFPKSENLDSRYLQYFLNSSAFVKYASHLNAGDRPRVDFDQLAPYPFPVVPLDQQKRIVAEIEKQFSRLDEAVANLKRVKANLKRYKAAVLIAAVEGRLVETEAELARREGRSYETGAQLLQRILETRHSQWQGKGKYKEPAAPDTTGLPELPEGWVWCNGAQLFTWSSGVNLPVKNLAGGDFPVYGGNGVNGWHTEANVIYPTLVIGRVGAGCGNVNVPNRKAWVTDNAIYAAWIPPDCNLNYLGVVFTTANLNAVAAGSGQPFVNQSILNEVLVAMPPVAEQQIIMAEIERRLSLLRVTEAQMDANLQRAERLRQSILSRAFSGTMQ
jgi:type I restriction enzyme S subunit